MAVVRNPFARVRSVFAMYQRAWERARLRPAGAWERARLRQAGLLRWASWEAFLPFVESVVTDSDRACSSYSS